MAADDAAEVVAKAVTATKPKTRYTIGRDAAITTRIARFAPDRLLDRILFRNLKPQYAKASTTNSPDPGSGLTTASVHEPAT